MCVCSSPLPSCESLGKSQNLPELQFLQRENGRDPSTYQAGLLHALTSLTKALATCLGGSCSCHVASEGFCKSVQSHVPLAQTGKQAQQG